MTKDELIAKVERRFGAEILAKDLSCLDPHVKVGPATWPTLARFLRDECGLNYLACLTGIDRGKTVGLEAIYHVERLDEKRLGIAVRIAVPFDKPEIPSVESVWRTADWHEREAYDLLGFHFTGHPNLVRILCAEDWEGHPLRKDYKSPDTYHGIKNNVV